jgi:hypothetical protein
MPKLVQHTAQWSYSYGGLVTLAADSISKPTIMLVYQRQQQAGTQPADIRISFV